MLLSLVFQIKENFLVPSLHICDGTVISSRKFMIGFIVKCPLIVLFSFQEKEHFAKKRFEAWPNLSR